MSPNAAATRTFVQAAIAFVTGGFLTEAWNIILSNHQIDPTTQGLITLFIVFVVTRLQNQAEASGTTIPGLTNLKNTEG